MYQGKNPAKNTGFSPRYSAPKRHSSLFLRTFLCRNTHVPPPPGPGPHPALARHPGPARSSPLRPSGPAPVSQFFLRRVGEGYPAAEELLSAVDRRRLGARCRCRRGQPECWRGLARRPSPTNKRRRERAALLLVQGRSAAPPAKPPPSPCSLARRAWASHGPMAHRELQCPHTKAPRGLFSCSQQASEHGDRPPQQFPACSGASGGRADAHRFSCCKPG